MLCTWMRAYSVMKVVTTYSSATRALMCSSMSGMRKCLENLLQGLPSGATRNFSKFQATSDRFTGDQFMNLGLPRLLPWCGVG